MVAIDDENKKLQKLSLSILVLNFVFFMIENFKTFLVPACPG